MRIQIASDLHLEFLSRTPHLGTRLVHPRVDADLLILAGDIDHALYGAQHFADWNCPVVMISGNHEVYGYDLKQFRDSVQNISHSEQSGTVHFLENRALELPSLPGVRILGTTLWTDYLLMGEALKFKAMDHARLRINDHRVIQWQGRVFTPEKALELHKEAKAWLKAQLETPFDGKTIVVTHHVPHRDGLDPQYAGDLLNCAFVSHLPELVELADLWVFGHTHSSFDFQVGKCRVVANPAGYIRNRSTGQAADFEFENPKWDPSFVVDLETPELPQRNPFCIGDPDEVAKRVALLIPVAE